jgi:hypothetical protein
MYFAEKLLQKWITFEKWDVDSTWPHAQLGVSTRFRMNRCSFNELLFILNLVYTIWPNRVPLSASNDCCLLILDKTERSIKNGQSRDNGHTRYTGRRHTNQKTQHRKLRRWTTQTPPKNRDWTQVPANGKQFLPLTRRPQCYLHSDV